MRLLASLSAILLLIQPVIPQTRILLPSGERQADAAAARADQNVPPPQQQPRKMADPVKLQQDADELANLAASIPPAVNQTNRGVLPKDTLDRLKRIEKLAKHLRGELAP